MLYQLSYASRPRGSRKKSKVKIVTALGAVKTRGDRRAGRSTAHGRPLEDLTTSEKAARQSEPEFALWLPLPERTGGDREKPHCPPGFVDRAYLVFFQHELRTTTQQDTDQVEVSLTPFSFGLFVEACQPEHEPYSAAGKRRKIFSPSNFTGFPESPHPGIL